MKEHENCEIDCENFCYFCDRSFHGIKNEDGLQHDLELPESGSTLAGNHYCHSDCGR